jgi:hypothetical protein
MQPLSAKNYAGFNQPVLELPCGSERLDRCLGKATRKRYGLIHMESCWYPIQMTGVTTTGYRTSFWLARAKLTFDGPGFYKFRRP